MKPSYTYVPQNSLKRLRGYRYHGEDRSYIYRYFWTPLCKFVVQLLPLWLSPNLITMTGLLLMCLSHVTLSYYMPKLTARNTASLTLDDAMMPYKSEFLPQPPYWVLILVCVSIFMYQFLDNLDGHQARRTHTSSPLGLFIDHGCDAFNCIISSLNLAALVGAGPTWKTWVILLNTVTAFFLNTWEQYYRGVLVLPVINGPNEGIWCVIGIGLWSAWAGGPLWWHTNTMDIPTKCLPAFLQRPAPEVAVIVERKINQLACYFHSYFSGHHGRMIDAIFFPFVSQLNCSASHIENLPRPTLVACNTQSDVACLKHPELSSIWRGNSVLQRMVLRFYDANYQKLSVRYNTLFVWGMTFSVVLTCAGNIYHVYKAINQDKRPRKKARRKACKGVGHVSPYGWLRRNFPFAYSLTQLSPLVTLVLMANFFFLVTHEDVFRLHPRIFCWTVGLLFTKLTMHLLLAQICGVEFQPFRRTFLCIFLLGFHIILTCLYNTFAIMKASTVTSLSTPFSISKTSQIETFWQPTRTLSRLTNISNESIILYELFILSMISFVHLVWNSVQEIALALDQEIFSVPPEKQIMLKNN